MKNNSEDFLKIKMADDILDPFEILTHMCEDYTPYKECTDQMIESYLPSTKDMDLINTKHEGYKSSTEVHAERIAGLINKISNNISIDPVVIYIDKDGHYEIDDGYHRLRAYLYLKEKMPVIIYGPE